MLTRDDKIALTNEGFFPLTFDHVRAGDIIAGTSAGQIDLQRAYVTHAGVMEFHDYGTTRRYNIEVLGEDGTLAYRDTVSLNITDPVWIATTDAERHETLLRTFDPNYEPPIVLDLFVISVFTVDSDGVVTADLGSEEAPPVGERPRVLDPDPEFERLLEEEEEIERRLGHLFTPPDGWDGSAPLT